MIYIEEEKNKPLSRLYILRSGKTGRATQCLMYQAYSVGQCLQPNRKIFFAIPSLIFKAFCFFESRVSPVSTISSYFPAHLTTEG